VYIPYVKGVSGKFKGLGNQYNIRTIFKTRNTLRLKRYLQQMAQCLYSIPCECGGSYIDETGRPLAVQLSERIF
jgi:hypothetical protein